MDIPQDLAPAPALAAEPPPYLLTRPLRQTCPVVFASPHSGRLYPPNFVAAARLDPVALRKSEDGFVDELFAAAPDLGAPLLAATFPRVFCDVNREPWELDPGMFDGPLPAWVNTASPRVGAGLGTIARVVATGEAVYRRKLSFAEAEDRIRRYWQPYHAALAALIAETRDEFGTCLLIDCHSMPTHPAQAGNPPDFVLGDAHGTACAPRATRLAEEVLAGLGYRVRRNDPYAGGYVTRHYGRPREGVHALQVEVARPLYMDEARIERLPRMAALQADITRLIDALAKADWSALR
ncbi:N-formylglutamate amidohydrolase [Paracraurococcus ruber]|uniref:N-formylglutamate amidohydrolase n=1 Tax=Paracraurococcus ruber TaxID=77675 RepID=UPI001057B73D|nr:N-formylglutamate amidohydrolase [Paracraurococcus ruber]TDG32212.1 N-formylglutamate amidohydrolase [Paracraurococcus ruber]